MERRAKRSGSSRASSTSLNAVEALQRRRGRALIGAAIVASIVMLVAWFPAAALFDQRSAIAAAATQVATLRQEDQQLAQESTQLTSPSAIAQLARSQYQLVEPGQRLVQVLPATAKPTTAASGQAPYPGDPGYAKIMAPSAVALLPNQTNANAQSHGGTPGQTLVHRILNTLEFWKR